MNRSPVRRDREEERGFALLIVFLLAATVAFALYQGMFRVAFESQRDKEELLIERGEQYQRAIQLYFAANKMFPAKIEDLENTNNKRYLRRRYIDPMTGKDDWRLIHVNGAGQLTDSLVKKPPAPPAASSSTQTIGGGPTSMASTGGVPVTGSANPFGAGFNAMTPPSANSAAPAPQAPNATVLPRPSDRIPGLTPPAPAVDPNDPSTWPPIALFPQTGNQPNGQPGQAGLQPGFLPAGAPFGQQIPGQQFQARSPSGQGFPGQTQFQPQPFQTQPFQTQTTPGQQFPGQQFAGQQFPGQQFPGQQFPGQQFPGQAAVPGTTVLNPQGNPVTVGPDGQLIPMTNAPGLTGNLQTGVNPTGFNQNGVTPAGPTPGGILPPGGTSPPPVGPFGLGGIPGVSGGNAGAPGGGGTQNAGLAAINNLLTMPSTSPNMPGTAPNMSAGGIAGVASPFKGSSIKVYKERSKYQEWEFIFELKNNATPGQQAPANPLQTGTNGLNPQSPSGQSNTNPLGFPQPGATPTNPSPFGLPQPGLGQSGLGQPGSSQPGFPQP